MRLTHSIIFAAASLAIVTLQLPAHAAPTGHAQAITAARAGQYDEALLQLEQLVQQNPRNLQYRYDWVTVLSWAGRHDEALLASQSIKLGKNVPSYVLIAIGKSALSAKTTDAKRAIAAYDMAVKREPRNADAALGFQFNVQMFELSGAARFLNVLTLYLIVIACLGGSLTLWALYNHYRFKGVDRRKETSAPTHNDVAEWTNHPPEKIAEWRHLSIMTVHHDAKGHIVQVSTAVAK